MAGRVTGPVSRRATLATAAGLPLAVAGCGDEGGTPVAEDPTPTASPTPAASPRRTPKPTRSATPVEGLIAAGAVPVGGGAVLADEGVVVTQPTRGDFRGFSATCTHQGCAVGSVDGGTINCPCHGSRFSIEDGSVAAGPATAPLPEVAVREERGQVVRA